MSSSSTTQGSPDRHTELDQHGLRLGANDYVEWKPDEKQHPRNWSTQKKTYNVALVCFMECWMTAISSSGVCNLKVFLRTGAEPHLYRLQHLIPDVWTTT